MCHPNYSARPPSVRRRSNAPKRSGQEIGEAVGGVLASGDAGVGVVSTRRSCLLEAKARLSANSCPEYAITLIE
jgi:hypothetical protein